MFYYGTCFEVIFLKLKGRKVNEVYGNILRLFAFFIQNGKIWEDDMLKIEV